MHPLRAMMTRRTKSQRANQLRMDLGCYVGDSLASLFLQEDEVAFCVTAIKLKSNVSASRLFMGEKKKFRPETNEHNWHVSLARGDPNHRVAELS